MGKEIKIFETKEALSKTVSVYGTPENPLFLAKEVAEWIEHSNTAMMLQTIEESEKGIRIVYTPGGPQEMWFLTEDGLYEVLMQSRKPIAKQFKSKVKEILKSIRKHGMYATPDTIEKILTDPDFIIKLAQELKDEKTKRIEAEKKIEADAPKVLFSESVAASSTDILIGNMAKILKQNGINIGQNRFYEWLRQHGYLMKDGIDKNKPTQKGMNLGVFRIQERVIHIPDKDPKTVSTTMITGKGQNYFVTKFLQSDNRAAS